MSRCVTDAMKDIFKVLQEQVADEDRYRIADVERHISASGDEAPVIDFVKKARFKSWLFGNEKIILFKYGEKQFLLMLEKYASILNNLGFELISDEAITQGAGMLAISNDDLPIKKDISSLQIINTCFGIEADPNAAYVEFEFSVIANFFENYCVAKLDDSRFPLVFEEDINRLICYLLTEDCNILDETIKTKIQGLLLLTSSRSIAASILNGIQNPIIEYTYLQFYQCIEYLFKLNNCFIISNDHNISLDKSIDIVISHELKISEAENLYLVLKNNASESVIDSFFNLINGSEEEKNDKYKKVSSYIYRLRCNIAHLRYDQDDLSEVNWTRCTRGLIDIISSIYQKLDANITTVCNSKHSWERIVY